MSEINNSSKIVNVSLVVPGQKSAGIANNGKLKLFAAANEPQNDEPQNDELPDDFSQNNLKNQILNQPVIDSKKQNEKQNQLKSKSPNKQIENRIFQIFKTGKIGIAGGMSSAAVVSPASIFFGASDVYVFIAAAVGVTVTTGLSILESQKNSNNEKTK